LPVVAVVVNVTVVAVAQEVCVVQSDQLAVVGH
jgi:hypothetical protein